VTDRCEFLLVEWVTGDEFAGSAIQQVTNNPRDHEVVHWVSSSVGIDDRIIEWFETRKPVSHSFNAMGIEVGDGAILLRLTVSFSDPREATLYRLWL